MGHPPDRVEADVDCEVEVSHIPEGGGGNFVQDPEVGTTGVACEGETTKSGYLTFEPGGISTINWRLTGGQVLESSRSPRGEPSSETSQNPTGSLAIPTPEDSCKRLNFKPILG